MDCPDWEERRRQDRQRYHRAVRIEYARIHASGAGFPELFISMSCTHYRWQDHRRYQQAVRASELNKSFETETRAMI